MVQLSSLLSGLTVALAALVVAHPGHDHKREAEVRANFVKHNSRSLSKCGAALRERGHMQRSIARRSALAEDLRKKQQLADLPYLKARDFDTVLNTSHHSNRTGLTADSSDEIIFSDNTSCVLQPDVTEGPYYVSGELIRRNVTESQIGVPLVLDVQIIDTSTCEPLSGIYLESWHCNATGVYSGVVANGNGNIDDASNINRTALRGIQQSDSDGVVQFDTIFPGHYTGRATHIHILTHDPKNVTVFGNGTLSGLAATHVGQLFFDQSLIAEVEATSPYSTNTQNLTTNADDYILEQEADSEDPMVEYVLLGDSIEDGLLAWASVGINTTESYDVSAAASYYASGGVENEDSGLGGGGGPGPGPSGTLSAATSSSSA